MKRLELLMCVPLLALGVAQAQTSLGSTSASGKAPASARASSMPLVAGTVERVDKNRGELVLNHGDLPNLGMPPMTMAFNVADRRMLDRVKRGNKVRFSAAIVGGEATVTHIEVVR